MVGHDDVAGLIMCKRDVAGAGLLALVRGLIRTVGTGVGVVGVERREVGRGPARQILQVGILGGTHHVGVVILIHRGTRIGNVDVVAMLEHERCLYDCLIRTFRVVSGGRRILAVLELLADLIDVLKAAIHQRSDAIAHLCLGKVQACTLREEPVALGLAVLLALEVRHVECGAFQHGRLAPVFGLEESAILDGLLVTGVRDEDGVVAPATVRGRGTLVEAGHNPPLAVDLVELLGPNERAPTVERVGVLVFVARSAVLRLDDDVFLSILQTVDGLGALETDGTVAVLLVVGRISGLHLIGGTGEVVVAIVFVVEDVRIGASVVVHGLGGLLNSALDLIRAGL